MPDTADACAPRCAGKNRAEGTGWEMMRFKAVCTVQAESSTAPCTSGGTLSPHCEFPEPLGRAGGMALLSCPPALHEGHGLVVVVAPIPAQHMQDVVRGSWQLVSRHACVVLQGVKSDEHCEHLGAASMAPRLAARMLSLATQLTTWSHNIFSCSMV